MKELSIEEKARKYDEAIRRGLDYIKQTPATEKVTRQEIFEAIFPEFKESEDEKIRKWLIAQLQIKIGDNATLNNMIYKAIDWLEKQSEAKPYSWKPSDEQFEALDYAYNSCSDTERGNYYEGVLGTLIQDLHRLKKPQSKIALEDDTADKLFNFEVGQWIVATEKQVYLIVKIDGFNVTLVDTKGDEYRFDVSLLKDARGWTLKDAKDGDVLVTVDSQRPFIFKGCLDSNHPDSPVAYGGIDADGCFFCSGKDTNNWWTDREVQPATKYQREGLMKAMSEAYYTFDFKKKELKKLKKFKVGDEVRTENEESLTITKIDKRGYWSNDLFICDFNSEYDWELVERKPSDMDEPKFHKGDWIISETSNLVYYVDSVLYPQTKCYYLSHNGEIALVNFDEVQNYRLWTLKDAKDGDVLVTVDNKRPFIYKNCPDPNLPDAPVAAYGGNDAVGNFCISRRRNNYWWTHKEVQPATKEQCDALLKAMAEAGWEFDFEKKELKKIEEPELTKFEEAVKDMMNDYRDAIGDNDATTEEVKKHSAYLQSLIPQTPAWSEEDEKIINKLIAVIELYYGNDNDLDKQRCHSWLKSLKDKYTWQPSEEDERIRKELINLLRNLFNNYSYFIKDPFYTECISWLEKKGEQKSNWSEEDEKRVERLLGWLDTLINYIHHDAIVSLDLRRERMQQIEQLKTWLKSLQFQNTWKPSDEQMNALDSTLQYSQVSHNSFDYLNALYNELKKLKDYETISCDNAKKSQKI